MKRYTDVFCFYQALDMRRKLRGIVEALELRNEVSECLDFGFKAPRSDRGLRFVRHDALMKYS